MATKSSSFSLITIVAGNVLSREAGIPAGSTCWLERSVRRGDAGYFQAVSNSPAHCLRRVSGQETGERLQGKGRSVRQRFI